MKIEGDHTFKASRKIVWTMLLDSGMLHNAIPGCQHLDQIGPRQYDLGVRIENGPLAGQYNGLVDLHNVVEHESLNITAVGDDSHFSLQAQGQINLVAVDDDLTRLEYHGDLVFNGRSLKQGFVQTPRLVQSTANAQLRQFFTALEHQIQIQTTVYTTNVSTTHIDAQPLIAAVEPGRRKKGVRTIDTRDKFNEVSRNRRVMVIVAVFSFLNLLAFIGMIVSGRTVINWIRGVFAAQVAAEVKREQQNNGAQL